MFTFIAIAAVVFVIGSLLVRQNGGPASYTLPHQRTLWNGKYRVFNTLTRWIGQLIHGFILIAVVQWFSIGYVPTYGLGYGPPSTWDIWFIPEIWFVLNCLIALVTVVTVLQALWKMLRWSFTNKWTDESQKMWNEEVNDNFAFATIVTMFHGLFIFVWYIVLLGIELIGTVAMQVGVI